MYMLVCTGIELLQISESPLLSFWLWTVCQTSPVQEPCVIHIEVKSLVEEILVCTWQLVLSSRVGAGVGGKMVRCISHLWRLVSVIGICCYYRRMRIPS